MTERQKAFDDLLARMMLPENYECRNPAIFDIESTKLMHLREEMERYLELLPTASEEKKKIWEAEFDRALRSATKILNEQGWK